jgi:hypothetical protein
VTAAATFTPEVWTYAGRRVAANGKTLVHAWVDDTGEERYYVKLKALEVGGRYTVEVARDGERVSVSQHVVWEGTLPQTGPDRERVQGWKAEDRAAQHTIERRREEKRVADDSQLEEALDVLRAHFAACPTYGAKWTFAQWVAAEVARPVRKATP